MLFERRVYGNICVWFGLGKHLLGRGTFYNTKDFRDFLVNASGYYPIS